MFLRRHGRCATIVLPALQLATAVGWAFRPLFKSGFLAQQLRLPMLPKRGQHALPNERVGTKLKNFSTRHPVLCDVAALAVLPLTFG